MKRNVLSAIVFALPAALWLIMSGCDTGDVKFGDEDFRDGVDDNTTYTAGPGLTETSEEFSADFAGNGSADTVSRSDHQHDTAYVFKAGDIMTGRLTLSADPTANLHAATRQYVDTRVLKSGDTMTGDLALPGNPTANLHAAPKQYVDGRVLKSGDTMTGDLAMSSNRVTGLADPSLAQDAATKAYADSRKSIAAFAGDGTDTTVTGTANHVPCSVTMTIPSSGKVIVNVSAFVIFPNAGRDTFFSNITTFNFLDSDHLIVVTDENDANQYSTFSATRGFDVSAGAFTVRFLAVSTGGTSEVCNPHMTAIFVPD